MLAFGLNAALAWLVFLRQIPIASDLTDALLEFTVIETPTPPPPPDPTPAPKPRVVEMTPVVTPIPTQSSTEPVEKPKPVFGISMTSTVEAGQGAFSVRVGNTIAKAPEKELTPPGEVNPLREVSFQQLEEAPRISRDFRAEYPVAAKEEGIEGTVILKLTIGVDGKVSAAKVVRGIHPDLDAAARAAAFQFTFIPGKVAGQLVITTNFVYRYTWLIDE